MPRRNPVEIPLDRSLRDCERWSTSLLWPAPLDGRLDALVNLAIEAGEAESLTRSELIAAVLLAAPAEGDALVELLRTYRKAKVLATVVPPRIAGDGADVIVLKDRKPGRR